MRKRFCSIILAAAMIMTMIPFAMAADPSGFDDVSGHWAESSIERWSGYGVVGGAGDGTFAPDGVLTRAQAAQIFANLLGLTTMADIGQYGDVAVGSWYYDAIAKCVAAGILTGDGAGAMSPEAVVSREQLFVMFARAMGIEPKASSDTAFADSGEVSSWAAGYINALADMGAIQGSGDGTLNPSGDMNRASFVAVLDQTISGYANTDGATVGGTQGIVLVVAENVTVVGNVENLVIAGGSAGISGSTVENITVSGDNASVSVGGSAVVGQVNVTGANASVAVSGQASVAHVTVADTAVNAGVAVDGDAAVSVVDSAASNVTISGTGTVETANVSGDNTTVNTDGTDLTVSQGTTGVTENNKPVSGGASVETQPETTQPSNPVNPPVYIPTYYTVNFVGTDGVALGSQTVVENTTGVTAPEVVLEEGQQVKWHNGTDYVDLSAVTVSSDVTLTAVVGSDDFAAGNGTVAYPYLVSNLEQFYAIDNLQDEMLAGTSYYFEQTADIVGLTHGVDFLRGTYDGAGYSLCAITGQYKGIIALFWLTLGDTIIKNVDTYSTSSVGVAVTYMASTCVNLTIENCHAYVDATDNTLRLENAGNFGFLIYYSIYDAKANPSDTDNHALENEKDEPVTVTLSNCTVNGNLQNTGNCAAAFIGQGYFPKDGNGAKLIIRNCTNNGNVTSKLSAGLITGNATYAKDANAMIEVSMSDEEKIAAFEQYYEITNVVNNGDIQAESFEANFIAENNGEYWVNTHLADLVTNNGTIGKMTSSIESKDLKLYFDSGKYYVNDSEYVYKLAFKVGAIKIPGGESNSRDVLIGLDTYTEQGSATLVNTANIHAYDSATAVEKNILTQDEVNELTYPYYCESYKVDVVVKEGKTYIIFEKIDVILSVDSSVTTYIYGYDKETGTEFVGSQRINQN